MRLSVVVITRNEQARLRSCLESVRGIADEIIVVDDNSTDSTRDIARDEFGAVVIEHDLDGQFDRQRNIGIDAASGEWVFQMDADETVASESAVKLIEAMDGAGDDVAFTVNRVTVLGGHPLRHAFGSERLIRLFRKNKARYTRPVHEVLIVDGPVRDLDVEVRHFPVESMDHMLRKALAYADLEAKLFFESHPVVTMTELRSQLTWRLLSRFWKLYIKKKGYRDGMPGLVWSVVHTVVRAFIWLKIWERASLEGRLQMKLR